MGADIYATDSSGCSLADAGGHGVMSKGRDSDAALRLSGQAERWRYNVTDAITARRHMPGMEAPRAHATRAARRGGSDFLAVTAGDVGNFSDWKLKMRGRWRLQDNIMRTEGRAVILAAGRHLRRVRAQG